MTGGQQLKAWREQLGWTQAEAAAHCGYSRQHYAKLEQDKATVKLAAFRCMQYAIDQLKAKR